MQRRNTRIYKKLNGDMKHYLWLMLAAVLMASCATTRRTSELRETHVAKDSVVTRDSIVARDSVVIRYETRVKDSTVVKDSVVLTIDQAGNVVKSEHYRNMEHNRDQNRDTANESRHEETQKGSTMQTSSEVLNHWAEKSEKTRMGVPWYVWIAGGVLVGCVAGIVWFGTVGWKKV